MRNIFVTVIMAGLLACALPAYAAFDGPRAKSQLSGGFAGPVSGAQADTVIKAMELPDGAPVVLTGNIVSQIAGKKDKFVFRDGTGEIRMEIDKKDFRGQTITPQDTVRVIGKVDKDFGKEMEIEAKQIEIVK